MPGEARPNKAGATGDKDAQARGAIIRHGQGASIKDIGTPS